VHAIKSLLTATIKSEYYNLANFNIIQLSLLFNTSMKCTMLHVKQCKMLTQLTDGCVLIKTCIISTECKLIG